MNPDGLKRNLKMTLDHVVKTLEWEDMHRKHETNSIVSYCYSISENEYETNECEITCGEINATGKNCSLSSTEISCTAEKSVLK